MNNTWQLQDAKNRFSELVETALKKGTQTITRHGKPTVVVVPIEQYKKMSKPKQSLLEFFSASPLKGMKINIDRSKEYSREIHL